MTRTTYHFTFASAVPMDAVEDALLLAAIAADAVAGDADGARRTTHVLDDRSRTCVIDARTAAGTALVRVFFAYIAVAFGLRAFRVVTGEDLVRPRRERRKGARR
ncbi:MAG: hypothetical protein K8T90_10380 [Planctomycetes bacterium]|nr:hypothetical protein [Planctomycetota bacterium]